MEETKFSEAIKIKKKHPIERRNGVINLFFCWLVPYFVKGFKRELNEDDMYGALKSHESERLGDKLEKAWKYEVTTKKSPSLWRALTSVFGFELVLYAFVFFFLEIVVKLTLPLLISKFLQFYEPNTDMTKNDAYMYAGLLVLASFLNVLCLHNYFLHVFHLAMKIKVATCSLIYRKALKLSKSALAETTIGEMVNLLSNDVGRFDYATSHIHYLWLTPIEVIVVMYLLYANLGLTALVGAAFLTLNAPFQVYLAKKTSDYRLKTALRTDERVRLMSEIITGIQVIKMYTWEKPFAKLVEISRRKEMQQIRANSIIRAIVMSCMMVLNRTAIYLCILTYVLTGNTITASYAFTVSSFYASLGQVLTMAFPFTITQIAETNVSINRILKFLSYDEVAVNEEINYKDVDVKQSKKIQNGSNGTLPLGLEHKKVGIHIKNVSTKWVYSHPEDTLENISFDVNSNQLVAVVGPVGSGKTTLLHAILKELPPIEGSLDVQGVISYAAQEPWLFGATIQENIVFGQEFEPKKYEQVVKVCALERDFNLFPYGDRTLVGERGVTLSGGQRARINLARAVYKEADIYLLDDPLSAVDTHVGRQLFDECICGFLRGKCVVLVTHQLQYLRDVQTIYALREGKVEASGTYGELQATDSVFTKLLNSQNEEEEKPDRKSKEVEDEEEDDDAYQDAPTQEREQRGSGTISWQVYKTYILAGGNWFKIILLALTYIISQFTGTLTDYFVNIWVNLEQWRSERSISTSNDSLANNTSDPSTKESLQSFLDLFMTQETSIIIYTLLITVTIILTIVRSISFFRYCMTASTRLHNLMFSKIVYAPMRFFNTNPSGRILNRFSKDIGTVDEILPRTILDTVQIGLMVLAIILVVGSLNPWILIPTLAILIIFYLLRIVFLATSRDIKRVDAVTRSPVYTHLSSSLQGLTTIRAFGAQKILRKEFDNYQNQNSAPYFMFLAANRTFGFWLDFHCVIYTALVVISILFIESEIFGGNVGLALTQSIALTGWFQWGMRQWSELENSMTSVERVHEYTEVTPEKDEKIMEPSKSWPEAGNIRFEKMCLRYSPDDPYVLKYLTLAIKDKEKIGIVGRTGAGKSSIIAALFRLTNIDGRIVIDNVNTKDISLALLRSKISIIPQEPVLFSGTLRKNLDPFDDYNDNVLWNALNEVEMKHSVSDLPAGLDSKMSEGGSNFSVGQRQLLCLARAIIRNNKILVLDEATANVDPHTDELIQVTIRRKFANCTVLTIAHRLHTIMDSDKVLVMDAGEAVEFDHPHKLLQNPNGVFYKLVTQTGKAMAENLISIARKNYKNLSL